MYKPKIIENNTNYSQKLNLSLFWMDFVVWLKALVFRQPMGNREDAHRAMALVSSPDLSLRKS
jgi:hypothetical protein